jgi:hypothetical protein
VASYFFDISGKIEAESADRLESGLRIIARQLRALPHHLSQGNNTLFFRDRIEIIEEMPEIDSSLKKVRRTLKQDALLSEERRPSGAFSDDKAKAEYEKNLRETLLNALRQSSSSQ